MTPLLQRQWCSRVAPGNPGPLPIPIPPPPLPKQPWDLGDPLVWGAGLDLGGGRAAPEEPERPVKPKPLYNHGLFLERTLTFGARRPSFKLKKARKAQACSCPLLAWVGGKQNRPSGLSPSHHPAPSPTPGAAQPGPEELGADATGAGGSGRSHAAEPALSSPGPARSSACSRAQSRAVPQRCPLVVN